jgi:2-haloacid dehalogenase
MLEPRPAVILLDVNETLSDMAALRPRFEGVGVAAELLETWFAATLRDGLALTAAGSYASFDTVARSALRSLLACSPGLSAPVEDAVDSVLEGFAGLPLHADVAPCLGKLHGAGYRVVTLSNGAAPNTRALLERGGVSHLVEDCLSVDDVGRWKPAPETYHYAAARCATATSRLLLVAVHPWDVAGARRAGLAAAWIDREGRPYPEPFARPSVCCPTLAALADDLTSAGAPAR